MQILWQDLRYGARLLLKNPGFTLIAVITLALGIGANTALFSVVDAMLLKKLPVKEPERLVLFKSLSAREFSPGSYTGNSSRDPATGQTVRTSFPYQSFVRMREQQSVLSDIFAFGNVSLNVNTGGQADVASGQAVSGNYYAGLGVPAMLGRTITEGDDQAASSPVAVLSYRYWQRRFGGDPAVAGKQVNLNNVAFTVVGVTPPGFEGTMQVGSSQDVSIPIAWEPQVSNERSRMLGAGVWWLRLMGRLKPGATAEQARASLEVAFHQSVSFGFGSDNTRAIEIVGLARDAKYTRQRDEIPPTAYLAWLQELGAVGSLTFEVRTVGDPTSSVAAIRQAVREVDGNLPLNNLRTQMEQADETLSMERLFARLLSLFGLLAQQLAAIGLYGVMAYSVSQRTREIGIRMALGAQTGDVLKMVVGQGMLLAVLGMVLGLAGAYALTRWLRSTMVETLYGVGVSDPLTYSLAALLLMAAALAACYIPARRAMKVDPMVALRYE